MTAQRFPVSGLIVQSARPDLQPGGLEVSSLKQLWNGQAVMLMAILLACYHESCNSAMHGVLDTPPSLIQRATVIVSESLLELGFDQLLGTNPI